MSCEILLLRDIAGQARVSIYYATRWNSVTLAINQQSIMQGLHRHNYI